MTAPLSPSPDVVVIGAGLVGLSCALALADRGHRVKLIVEVRRGEASPAAGGLLAPSVDRVNGPAFDFAVAARDRFPAFVARLQEETGIAVPLHRDGVIELADSADAEARLREEARAHGERWLEPTELAELEPGLAPARGAVLHELDGGVNNLVLLRALKTRLGHHPRVTIVADSADAIEPGPTSVTVPLRLNEPLHAGAAVLAGGAWSTALPGLPRRLAVEPVRGQMLSVAGTIVRRPVIGTEGYLIPRGDGRTLLGGTMERVGFDPSTSEEGLALVRRMCEAIAPATAKARTLNGWAGLRPMTPDTLPIIGREPLAPSLIYATGHSRNGVLLCAITGEVVARMLDGEAPGYDMAPFAVERFG